MPAHGGRGKRIRCFRLVYTTWRFEASPGNMRPCLKKQKTNGACLYRPLIQALEGRGKWIWISVSSRSESEASQGYIDWLYLKKQNMQTHITTGQCRKPSQKNLNSNSPPTPGLLSPLEWLSFVFRPWDSMGCSYNWPISSEVIATVSLCPLPCTSEQRWLDKLNWQKGECCKLQQMRVQTGTTVNSNGPH